MRALGADPAIARPAIILTTASTSTRSPPSSCTRSTTCSSRARSRSLRGGDPRMRWSGDAREERTLSGRWKAVRSVDAAPLTRLLVRDQGKIVAGASSRTSSTSAPTPSTRRWRPAAAPISSACRSPASTSGSIARRFLKVNRSCLVDLDFVESMTPDEKLAARACGLRDGSKSHEPAAKCRSS